MMILYLSGKYHQAGWPSWGIRVEVDSAEKLQKVAALSDYAFAKFKDGTTGKGVFAKSHRSKDDFLYSQCLYGDVDDGGTIAEFQKNFGRWEYFITTSKSHLKVPGQERFHFIFPVEEKISSASLMKDYLKILHQDLFKMQQMDPACIEPSRLFYGNKTNISYYNKGEDILPHIKSLWKPPKPYVKKTFKVNNTMERWIANAIKRGHKKGWFDDYDDWLKLGIALKNSGLNMDLWLLIAKDEADVKLSIEKWSGFSGNGVLGKDYIMTKVVNRLKY